MTFLKTFLFTVLVPGTVAGLVPYLLATTVPYPISAALHPARYLGFGPFFAGAMIYLWCAYDFTFAGQGTPAPIDPPKELVVRGLYRFVRNPMYLGVLLILLGETILFNSLFLLIYALLIVSAWHLFVVYYEEPTLARLFGQAYEDYRRSVPRWVPRFRRP